MYRFLRNIHLLLGLFSAAAVLMYGISSVQMAHQWFNVRPVVSEQTVTLSPGLDRGARVIARELMDQHGLSGELAQIRIVPTGVAFRLNRPGTSYEVDYNSTTAQARVRTQRPGFMGMMVRFHHVSGLWHEFSLTNVFGAFLGVVSFALILMGLTGLYLWFKLHKERRIGVILLAVNLIYSLTLIFLIRAA